MSTNRLRSFASPEPDPRPVAGKVPSRPPLIAAIGRYQVAQQVLAWEADPVCGSPRVDLVASAELLDASAELLASARDLAGGLPASGRVLAAVDWGDRLQLVSAGGDYGLEVLEVPSRAILRKPTRLEFSVELDGQEINIAVYPDASAVPADGTVPAGACRADHGQAVLYAWRA